MDSKRSLWLVSGALAMALAGNGFLFWKVKKQGLEVAEWRASMARELADLREASSATAAASHQRVESLKAELEGAQRQAARAAGQAKVDAQKHADRLARELAEAQKQQQEQVQTELAGVKEGVKQAADSATTQIAGVSSEVAATKAELQGAISDLKRVTGDMGVMSGLIATNAGELSALRTLGERNYFEFNLVKNARPQRVGSISLLVKKTDIKRNRFTVDILADDKRIEKKDKTVNEPVQFYTSGARQPYELVVNQVGRDRLVGYLAAPKIVMARK